MVSPINPPVNPPPVLTRRSRASVKEDQLSQHTANHSSIPKVLDCGQRCLAANEDPAAVAAHSCWHVIRKGRASKTKIYIIISCEPLREPGTGRLVLTGQDLLWFAASTLMVKV